MIQAERPTQTTHQSSCAQHASACTGEHTNIQITQPCPSIAPMESSRHRQGRARAAGITTLQWVGAVAACAGPVPVLPTLSVTPIVSIPMLSPCPKGQLQRAPAPQAPAIHRQEASWGVDGARKGRQPLPAKPPARQLGGYGVERKTGTHNAGRTQGRCVHRRAQRLGLAATWPGDAGCRWRPSPSMCPCRHCLGLRVAWRGVWLPSHWMRLLGTGLSATHEFRNCPAIRHT